MQLLVCIEEISHNQVIRTYTELSKYDTFLERFRYLRLDGEVAFETFGYDRYLNQIFYNTIQWQKSRRFVILRDQANDLGIDGYPINGQKIIIHHLIPITREDILNRNPDIYNPEFLICTTMRTHNAIHYGDESLLPYAPIVRRKNDTCPWREGGN